MEINLYEPAKINKLINDENLAFIVECNTSKQKKIINIPDEYFSCTYSSEDEFVRLQNFCRKQIGKQSDWIVDSLTIVLHGWGTDSSLYENVSECISENSTVMSFDFYGFGKNNELNEIKNITDYAMQFLKIITLFEFEKLNVVAHSFGARVFFHALKMCINVSDFDSCFFGCEHLKNEIRAKILKLKGVVLTGPAGVKPRFNIVKFYKIKKYKSLKEKCKSNQKYMKILLKYGSKDYKNAKNTFFKNTFVSVVNSHTFEELSDTDLKIINYFLKSKFLILQGKKDKQTPLYMAKKIQRKLTNSKLVVFDKSAHFCFLDENPKFVNFVNDFLCNCS